MKTPNLDDFSLHQINESKNKAQNWAKAKYLKLEKLKNSMPESEYEKKSNLINQKLIDRINLLNKSLDKRKNSIPFTYYILIAVAVFTLWLQPWEYPVKKLSDEWKNCNNKYDGQCSYVGKKFKTNSFEMFISESLHGEYVDNECSRSIYWKQC